MICKHQFFKIGDVSRLADDVVNRTASPRAFVVGIEIVCGNCGQVRQAFSDGVVKIKVQGQKPIEEDHVELS